MEQVREFYAAFNQDVPPSESQPSLDNDVIKDRVDLKMDLIAEEFFELVEAVYGKKASDLIESQWSAAKALDDGNRDIVETADALADMEYVIAGMAIEANIPLDEVFDNVHESNMSKLGEDGKPILSDGVTPDPRDGKVKPNGKILKGANFWEPNIPEILFGYEK